MKIGMEINGKEVLFIKYEIFRTTIEYKLIIKIKHFEQYNYFLDNKKNIEKKFDGENIFLMCGKYVVMLELGGESLTNIIKNHNEIIFNVGFLNIDDLFGFGYEMRYVF